MTMSHDSFDEQWTLEELEALLSSSSPLRFDPLTGELSGVESASSSEVVAPRLAAVMMVAPREARPRVHGVSRKLWEPAPLRGVLEEVVDAQLELLPAASSSQLGRWGELEQEAEPAPLPEYGWEQLFDATFSLPEGEDGDAGWSPSLAWDDPLFDELEQEEQPQEKALAKTVSRESKERYLRRLVSRLDGQVRLRREEFLELECMLSYSGNPATTLAHVVRLLEEGWSLSQLRQTQLLLMEWAEHGRPYVGWGDVLRFGDCFVGELDAEELFVALDAMVRHWRMLRARLYVGLDRVWGEPEWLEVPHKYFNNFLRYHVMHELDDVAWVQELVEADLGAMPRERGWGYGGDEAMMRAAKRRGYYFDGV